MKPQYTIQKCSFKKNEFYGSIHYSEDCNQTLCGQEIDEKWWVLTNNCSENEITCKKCRANIK